MYVLTSFILFVFNFIFFQSKYVEAIGILEELLKIKKMHFGTNSKEVIAITILTFLVLVYKIMQTTLRDMQHIGCVLPEERRCQ